MLLLSLLFTIALNAINVECHIVGESSQYIRDDVLSHYKNDDYSSWTPLLETGGRVIDLMNGEFFDEHLRDTPDHMRPPAVVAFYNSFDSECMKKYHNLDFDDTVKFHLPSRAFLFAAKYDIGSASRRTWYKFIPERDLASRFGISSEEQCPAIVFVPSQCNGFTEWCVNQTDPETGIEYLGCNNYVDQCQNEYKIWDPESDPNYREWIENEMKNNGLPGLGGPKLDGPNKSNFTTFEEQEQWLLSRDDSTQRENYRNNWVSSSLPAFTELGYKAIQMSEEHINAMREFYGKWRHKRRPENWNSKGQTAVNGHEVEPSMVSLDMDMEFRDMIVNRYVKPALEEWVGFPLRLTSHYGIREYYDGNWLKNHIDRIDVLIISATQSLGHLICNTSDVDGYCNNDEEIDWESGWPQGVRWPLEGVDWHGNNVRYEHKPGTMIMYESAKFIHGRPFPMPTHPDHPRTKYVHLGAFCHFTPADGSWKRNGHDTNARKNIHRHTKGVHYKGNPQYYPPKGYETEKPELYVNTKQRQQQKQKTEL